MTKSKNINILFVGEYIRIGESIRNKKLYFQPIDTAVPELWFRFAPEYYYDYKEYLRDFTKYLEKDNNYPNPSTICDILDEETLTYYITTYQPDRIFINKDCVYSTSIDVKYTVNDYCSDVDKLAKLGYIPVISSINILKPTKDTREIIFVTKIEHKLT